MLGLARNVLTWDAEQLGTWLDGLGLGELVPNFQGHNVDGGTVFLLTEEHLKELGFSLVGDRLYFVEVRRGAARARAFRRVPRGQLMHARASDDGGVCSPRARVLSLRLRADLRVCSVWSSCAQLLTQLYDDIVNWSAALGIQLATHPVPPLRKLGLSLNPTSWTVKDVCKVLKAVNLGEYMELFVEHRIQGDVLFSLTEQNLQEMGVGKVGDRLLITDITQTLYEQITGWQQQNVQKNNVLALGQGAA